MFHGVDAGQKDIIHLLVDKLLHVTIDQLDRVAGLTLCQLLGKPDGFLTGRVGQDYVEPQRGKERICHGKEFVDHQHKGHAHRLFARVAFPRVAFQKQVVGLPVKINVSLGLGAAAVLCGLCRAVKPDELAGRIAHRFLRQQGRAVCAADGEHRADPDPAAIGRLKSRHDAWIVIHAALQYDVLSDRFGADHFVQVVLHDGVAQSGRNICLWNAFGSGRSNGSFNEYRTALAQCGRALCGQRQRTKFYQRDPHAGGLFLYKRTGARCADLVHLEIHDLTVFQADVFAVLPADLKDSIHLRHPVRSAFCLCRDLVPHGIRADAFADALPPGTGHAYRRKAHCAKTFPDTGQPLTDGSFRVACSAQILEIHQFSLRPHQNKVGARGTDINAQRTAFFREDTGGLRLGKICTGQQFQSGKPGRRGVCCHCIVQQRIQLCQCKCTFCLACCTDGRFKTRFFRDDQFRFGQAEHIPDSPYHAGVAGHAAAEYHWFADRQPPHNGRLVVTDHRIAQSQQDIRRGNAFLLAVNDIRFGKHCAASGKPRDALRLLNQRRIILQLAAHTGHLILKKGPGAACAMLVGRKLRGSALDFRDEPRTLTADFNNRTGLRHKPVHTFHDGRDFSQF